MKKEEAKEILEKFLEDKPNFREEHTGQDEEVYRQMDRLTEALDMAIRALSAIEQVRWERDVAIQQLTELGYGLGEKPRTQPKAEACDRPCTEDDYWNCNDCDHMEVCRYYPMKVCEYKSVPHAQLESLCNTCRYLNLEWDADPCDSCTMGGESNHYKPSEQPAQDCISRAAAIDALDSFILDETTTLQGDTVREVLEALPSAQPDWGKPVGDGGPLADSEVVPRLRDIQKQIGGSYAIDRAIEVLEGLPSAQSEPHWIPCSERLPKIEEAGTSRMVLLCWTDGQVTVGAYAGDRTFVGQAWPKAKGASVRVIAWMPLPEPYEGQK